MAMDFWEAQRRARLRTTWYLILFALMTVTVAVCVELVLRGLMEDYDTPIPVFGLIFAAITFLVSGYQYSCFKLQGGSYVAESLGAYEVDPNTADFRERQLVNIVTEIAVASSLPVPKIYIIDGPEINAFAAGLTPEDAAVTVTGGAIDNLTRDEMQGVIAHEFGHIKDGDMRVGMRLAAMVMGFYILFFLGLRMLQFSPRNRDDQGRGSQIALIAFVFLVAGALTLFFGSILKACVSRQREYLADASAVQFTRNPDGITNALKKIAGWSVRKMPISGLAFSHLYFDDKEMFSSIFATHPPIEKRIAALEGREYLPKDWESQNPEG